jgi:hypothetical protein
VSPVRSDDEEEAAASQHESCHDHPEPTDATTMPCQVCVFSTLVSEADTIHTPAIKNSRKATSATLTPVLCEKARSLTSRRC